MLERIVGGITGGISGAVEGTIGGFANGFRNRHKDHRRHGYGFEEHKEFMSHVETKGGYSDRLARYDHHKRLPAHHGHPPMAVRDEEDQESVVEEFFESSRSHHTSVLPHHNVNMGNRWHRDRLMAPQVSPHHVYMNPAHATANWPVSERSGGHRKHGW